MKIFITHIFQRDLEYYPGNLGRIWYLTLIVAATIVLYCEGTITSTVLPLVLHAFHLSLVGYSIFAVIAILLSAPVALLGSLSDRFGRANIIIFGLFVCSIIMLSIALTTILSVYLALLGIFICLEAMLYVVAPALVRDFSPRLRRATAMGFWLVGPIGGLILATSTSSLILARFNAWQYPYAFTGVVGLFVFLMCFLGLRELSASLRNQVIMSAQEKGRVEAQVHLAVPAPSMRGAWRQVLHLPILLGAIGYPLYQFLVVTVITFFPLYLSSSAGYPLAQADAMLSVFWVVYGGTALLVGFISDLTIVRKPYILLGCMGTMIGTLLLVITTGHPTSSLLIITVLCLLGISNGISSVSWMAGFTEMVEQVNPALVATGLAVLGFFQRFFAVVIFLTLPQVMSHPGWGGTVWWEICLAGMVLFLPTIFLMGGYWNPVRARQEIGARLSVEGSRV
jgi:MFS family permease